MLRNRLVPALLTATGVSLIAAGLLTYTGLASAGPLATPGPTAVAVRPTPTPTLALPTFPPPSATPTASVSPTPVVDRVATRVVIPALGIDLPVIRPRGGADAYPQCNVAMYIQQLKQPGQGGATYLYAHARDGMFGPIYERAIQKKHGGPDSMVGMLVEVYTSDDKVFTYQVDEVRLDQRDLIDALNATTEQLWLQTSEGPRGTPGKTQLIASALTIGDADHADAHPPAKPVNCG
jgi:sortase (surface protein transpeptidase)